VPQLRFAAAVAISGTLGCGGTSHGGFSGEGLLPRSWTFSITKATGTFTKRVFALSLVKPKVAVDKKKVREVAMSTSSNFQNQAPKARSSSIVTQ